VITLSGCGIGAGVMACAAVATARAKPATVQAVHAATLLQQTNGHAKIPEEGKSAEIREVNTARRELSRISAVKVLSAKAGMQRRVATSAPSD
jgi:hypothetical protein